MRWFLRRGVARPGAIEATVSHYAQGRRRRSRPSSSAPARGRRRRPAPARIAVLTGAGRAGGAGQRASPACRRWRRRRISSISPSGPAAASARSRAFISRSIRCSACRSSRAAASAVPATDDYEHLARDRAVETLVDAHAGLTQEIAARSAGPGRARCLAGSSAGRRPSAPAAPSTPSPCPGLSLAEADGRGRHAGRSAAQR